MLFRSQAPTGQLENPFIAINAGEQQVKGVELGLIAAVTSNLTLSTSAALMDGKFTFFPNAGCTDAEFRDAATGPCFTLDESLAAVGDDSSDAQLRLDRLRTPRPPAVLPRGHGQRCQLVAGTRAKEAQDRKSTRLNSSHMSESRMPSSA